MPPPYLLFHPVAVDAYGLIHAVSFDRVAIAVRDLYPCLAGGPAVNVQFEPVTFKAICTTS
jgi:hypothetical protein